MFKVGDVVRLRKDFSNTTSPLDGPMTITEVFEDGSFKYKYPERIVLGSRLGWTEGGTTIRPDIYELVTND